MKHELLDVVKHAAAFLDRVQNAGKIVVCEYYVTGVFGNV